MYPINQTNQSIMKTKVFSLLLIAGLAFSASTFAQSKKFNATHPRRAEVNHRLNHQDNRIHKEVKEGEMSKTQAAALHQRDRNIRNTEKYDASKHNGHLTKAEQARLNKRENNVSKSIGK